MNEFELKGCISNEHVMINVLNEFPEEYDVIMDKLKNHLMSTGNDAQTIKVTKEKLNQRYEKNENKNEEKKGKEKVLVAYKKQYKGRCIKCGKYGHKSTDPKCPEKTKEEKRGKGKNDETEY